MLQIIIKGKEVMQHAAKFVKKRINNSAIKVKLVCDYYIIIYG